MTPEQILNLIKIYSLIHTRIYIYIYINEHKISTLDTHKTQGIPNPPQGGSPKSMTNSNTT